ncbi:hypothetical protein C1Y63_04175 [Corynebacterium sp. 13CS0277]|uniref:DUF3068 domain-containing protein n=1 Tax=Corynebacterium sp. 13CS0277 TaxID=2071994 RepID=UPI000D02F995|nr:DUF3068 domain-containing protein [Corynebacterium sp. 13CS0277]PRQ11845.1 hypothetical protein C1Y63_04175 [Corynebacterium sp. 13CS0277]
MGNHPPTRRRWARLALGCGAGLVAFTALMPAVLIPQLKTIPLDAGGTTSTAVATARLLQARAFATNTPLAEHAADPTCAGEAMPMHCFVGEVPVQGVRHIAAVEPSNRDDITLRAGNVLLRTDIPEPDALVSASVDTVTLHRHAAFPVDEPTSTFHMTAPDLGLDDTTGGFVRDGLQYQFPFDTAPRSYPYFDTTAQASSPIDFVNEEKIHGRTVYHFHQDVGAVDMFTATSRALQRDGALSEQDKAVLAGMRMRSTMGRWYTPEELAALGKDPEEPVVMTRYYAVSRDLRVEPHTGVIVNGQEQLHYFFASSPEEAEATARAHFRDPAQPTSADRTALVVTAAWDEETQARQFATADEGATRLAWLFRLKFFGLILGVVLVAWGAYAWRRRG